MDAEPMPLVFGPLSQGSNAVRLLIYGAGVQASFVLRPTEDVPALTDAGVTISGAMPIMKHIVERLKLADHFYPADTAARANVDAFLAFYAEKFPSEATGAFGKTFFSELEHPNVDAELMVIEETLKTLEEKYLATSKFIGGDSGPSIADLLVAAELIQAQAGRLLSSLFNFPKVAALVQNVRSLPGSLIVFAELEAFARALPPVKNAQVTIRGDREVLKNLRGARPKRNVRNSKGLPAHLQ